MNEHYIADDFVLVFKTNIKSKWALRALAPLLNAHHYILNWSVDLADIDRVLRIEATRPDCAPVIALVTQAGFHCEELTD
jgi:hypothetical protein